MDRSTAPVGVMDSGLGGISVLKALVRELPEERFLFYGDSAHAPYGTKTADEVRRLSLAAAEHLAAAGVKALVVACNTATSAAIELLRDRYRGMPVIGMEPAVKPAAEHASRVLVLATPMTLAQDRFAHLLAEYSADTELLTQPCPGIVELVEQGKGDSEEMLALLRHLLRPYMEHPVDAVVLGCTHYPFAAGRIEQALGCHVAIYDGAAGTARQTRHRLQEEDLLAPAGAQGGVTFENSMPGEKQLALSRQLFETPLPL